MANDLLDALAKPPPPPSELDELMDRNPLDLIREGEAAYRAWTDKVVAYQRQARARREAAPKGRGKRTDLAEHDNSKPIDLAALGLVKTAAPAPKSTTGGFRRL